MRLALLLCKIGLHRRQWLQQSVSPLFSSRTVWRCFRCQELFETVQHLDGNGYTRRLEPKP